MRTNVRWLSIFGIAIRYNRKDISITVIKGPEASLTAKSVLQCLHKLPNKGQVLKALSRITSAYLNDPEPWVVGYSGGKDSTAVVKLIFQSLIRLKRARKPVTVIYCDTGVEVPLASALARQALNDLELESAKHDLPISVRVLSPPAHESYWVKVIGRGYPPPTDKFRWCTDLLRIDPVTRFLESEDAGSATVILGVRESESATRSLTLAENQTSDRFWRTQRGKQDRRLFMPILDYSIMDVWRVNLMLDLPHSLRAEQVADLYADASGECPTVRDVKGAPCGKARFGCWTCTVAKNGTTLRNLIASGHTDLEPLLEFRLWLERDRNNPRFRRTRRRNGMPGPGPMTLPWRRLALKKLLKAEGLSKLPLISTDELKAIRNEWQAHDA
jgi:DNA sulfur modification protein DndC